MVWAAIAGATIGAGASIYSSNKANKAQNSASAANDKLTQAQFDEDKRRYDLNREDQERWGMMQINGEEEMDRRNRADKEQSYQRGAALNQGNVDRGNVAGNQLSYRMGLGGTGTGAAGGLNERYKDFNFNFEADPSYQFQREEGMRGVGNQFAQSGNLLSGAALKAMQRFGTGLADQSYNTSYNRARSGYESDRGDFNASNTNEFNRLAGIQGAGQNAINSTNGLGSTVQGSAGNGASGVASGMANASAQLGQSSNNYYNNLMGNNNSRANSSSAYNNAYGNAIGGGLGTAVGAWNSYQKNNSPSYSYPKGNSGGYDYLEF
jgi:hypothetical protein